jgi:hypothetical protein
MAMALLKMVPRMAAVFLGRNNNDGDHPERSHVTKEKTSER